MAAGAVGVDVVFDDLRRPHQHSITPQKERLAQSRGEVTEGVKGKAGGEEHTPKQAKSVAITISVRMKASAATSAPRSEPTTPAPRESRNAMKARPQAIGCRIMT